MVQVVCVACKRVEGREGWRETEVSREAEVSYGYCPACFQLASQFLRQGRKSRLVQPDGMVHN
ncbi:MAG: hypothetical protein ACOY3Z_13540 [Thermodesulfobacteriota bacterium]